MRLFKKLKKGFTLIELVVVIAVIAILSAVSLISYSSITNKAHQSNDKQLIDHVNLALAGEEILDGKQPTVHQMLQSVVEDGFIVENLKAESKKYEYAYYMPDNRFVILEGKKVVYPEEYKNLPADYNIWRFYKKGIELNDGFSYYLTKEYTSETVVVNGGLDVGALNTIKTVNYVNNVSSKDVVIRTNTFGTKLTVNGTADDTVIHYGFAGLVEVKKVAMASYDEYGVVGRLYATATGATGHIDIKAGATVYQVEQLGGDATKVSVDANATVYDVDQQKVNGVVVNETERFTETITATHQTDDRISANECLHNGDTEIVVDGQHAYEVCKKCGYTLISIVKNDTNEVQRTVANANNEIEIIPMATYAENQIAAGSSVSESDGIVKLIEDNKTETGYVEPEIQKTPKVDENIDNTCKHTWVENLTPATCKEDGYVINTCNKCGAKITTTLQALDHDFSGEYKDNGDGTHSQKCIRCNEYGNKANHVTSGICDCGFKNIPANAAFEIVEKGEYYTDLQEAMQALSSGQTLKFLKDYTLTSQTTKGLSTQNCIIDLNEKTLTASGTWKLSNTVYEYMSYTDYIDWSKESITEAEYNQDPYLLGMTENPVNVTVKNGTYVVNGTDSGRIRFEKGSTGIFTDVTIKSSSDTITYQGLQTYAGTNDGTIEKNNYSFTDCYFKNVYLGFEGKSGSCNKYDIAFNSCDFDISTNKNGFSAIAVNSYNYGDLSINNCTFDIVGSASGGAAYAFNISSALSSTNGKIFDVILTNSNINVSGNANPYAYSFAYVYNASPTYYAWNANVETDNKTTITKDGKTVVSVIKETSATSKTLMWTENAEAFTTAYNEYKNFAVSGITGYNSSSYYLVKCNGYYFVAGQSTQFMNGNPVIKYDGNGNVIQVKPNQYYTFSTIGQEDLSTNIGSNDNADVQIYSLAN